MNSVIESSSAALCNADPQIASCIASELERQQRNIELIASENIVSPAVLAAMGTVLTNKYAEGYPGNRYYGGCEYVDVVESIAIERAKALFGAEYANVQPHSGAQANLAVYAAFLQPGDTLVGMDLNGGGHLTHGAKANLSGKYYNSVSYGVNAEGYIDYDEVESLVKENRPKILVCGASAYPRVIDFAAFADIAHRYGAILMTDMAHIAGLVAGGVHESPIPYADIVTTTTHKTLRGPRGGMILAKEEYGKKLNSAIFPGTQGGPLMHIITAKAVCLKEAMEPSFAQYARNIVTNASVLADEFLKRGVKLVSGGTDNHLMLLDLRGTEITGKYLQEILETVNITANKNAIPNDPLKASVTSGLRIGTPAVTTRGFDTEDMKVIAECISRMIFNAEKESENVRGMVAELTAKHPIYR